MKIKDHKKILLIEPPFFNLFGYRRWHYPITLTLVGTYFEEQGHEVKIYDGDKPFPECRSFNRTEAGENYHLYEQALKDDENPSWKNIEKIIQDYKPDIIGLTSVSAKIDSANKIAKISKELFGNDIEVILGGPHIQGMVQMFPNYNFGDYYDNVIPFIPNLVNRKPNKKLLMDYDNYSPKDLSSLLTSTGCPNSCTFCCNSGPNKKIIYRDFQNLEQEIKELKEQFDYNGRVQFIDDCFFSNKPRLEYISKLISENELKFGVSVRIMALSKNKIETFMNNGGEKLGIGIESGSQKILDSVNKNLKIDEIKRRTKWLNEYGLPWASFFMVGFPFETLDDLKLTEELIHEIEPTFIALNRFTPYPGTQIWRDYYMDSNIKFRDLFQQNLNSVVKLNDDIDEYIGEMFHKVDKYNIARKDKWVID